ARSVNEDFCGIFEEDGLAIVCDGMGGHNAGANASRLAVTTIRYMYLFLDPIVHDQITKDLIALDLNVASRLIGSVRLANRNVYNKSIRDPNLKGMGTTVSALAIRNGVAVVAHVGDSRIYRIRQDSMDLLTEDHTWVNELIQDQEIDHEQAKQFEKQNVITRALGLAGSIKIDMGIEPIRQGDLFLICTDGLTKALKDEEIKRIVLFNRHNFDHTLRHLIDVANVNDGSDNISVALISIEELNPSESVCQATYLTLRTENEPTIRQEDKILKREIYNRTTSEWSGNNVIKIIKDKYIQLSSIVFCLVLVIFLGMYAFLNHPGKRDQTQIEGLNFKMFSQIIHADSIQMPTKNNDQVNHKLKEPSSEIENMTLPDSVINKLITASFENQTGMTHVSKVRSRSLQKNFQNRGKIYLTGLEKFNSAESTSLFINNNYWGKTEDFWTKGLLLRPGSYTIMIRDSTNKILFQQKNIKVSEGDIKAIEIKGR
ncbi:MAG: serine/threonine-protein phosphatase, partial [bacterium]